MQGNTNAVIGKGGGGGATVTAINRTGTTLTVGSKVWLNEQQQTQGSIYQIGTAGNYQEFRMGAIDRTGLFGVYYNYFYNIGEDSAELVGAVPNASYLSINRITYMADNSVFANTPNYPYRFDGQSQWNTTAMYCIADNWFSNERGSKIYQVDMSNGEIINTFTNSREMVTNTPVKVGDYIYRLYGSSNAQYKWLINYDTLTLTQSYYTFTNAPYQYDLISAGVTADNKYILCSQFTPAYTNGGNYLYIVEVLEDGNLRGLSQSEMPVDMQKWYSTKCGFVFNPYTGILTVYEYNGADYGIYKYENGTWTQLPIDLGTTEETKFCAPITVSDDLSRACYTHYSNYNQGIKASVIVNLTTIEGYVAVPYRFYNVTENTITGYAGNDAESGVEVEVSIAGQPSV